MFVAYLVPKHDSHLVVEDGLGYLETAPTREEAIAKVWAKLHADCEEQNTRAIAAGYETEPVDQFDDDYVCHTCEA